ncbi:MAG TPA: ParB/RepB/Spo0J family partition protein [Candidatus Paceibacterota bacterium]|nr:ParB/RepB/Spo0J family partition protein [Candidatus Paceibacterota bacterium]
MQRFTDDEIREFVETKRLVMVPWQLIRPWADQPRKHFDPRRLAGLAESVAKGQCEPVKVMPILGDHEHQFELTSGERRWRACREKNLAVECWVREYGSLQERHLDAIMSNWNRDGHTKLETIAAVERLRFSPDVMALPKGKQIQAVAETFGRSEKWVFDYLSLRKLPQEILKLLRPGRHKRGKLSFLVAVRLASLPPVERRMAWARIKKGRLSHTQAHRHINKTIVRKKLSVHRRGRVPSDDLKLFASFLAALETRVTTFLDMSDAELGRMIAGRSREEREVLLDQMDMAVQGVERIHQRLRAAIKTNPIAA